MSWFAKLLPSKIRTDAAKRRDVPEGLWTRCDGCQAVLYRPELERHLYVCPKCDGHRRISARQRLDYFLDEADRVEIAQDVMPMDRLKFRDSKKYKDRLTQAQKNTQESEALLVMQGRVRSIPVVVAAFDFGFMGGSMSPAVGERFVQGVQAALAQKCAFICFSASGGARMQEGLFSLLQMSKTSAALTRLAAAKLPFISVLTDPTMGGVSASFAMLGDIIVAEPNALIGFAGPRVIEQTVRETLPEGFQRSEFLLAHGALDMIVDRRQLRSKLSELLAKLLRLPTPTGAN